MHTIIINTMGSELRQNQLFYLPFPAERFHWLEKPLGDISQCADEIAAYHDAQGTRQKYHLILLVSLAQLASVQVQTVRQKYIELLRAYLNEQFLYPLCQNTKLPPVGTSIVFMLQEMGDGTGGVPIDRELDHIFGIQQDTDEVNELCLRDKNGDSVLDMTGLFRNAIEAYCEARKKQQERGGKDKSLLLKQLRENLTGIINGKQECQYIPVGKDKTVPLNCDAMEFAPLSTDWRLSCVDLQLNLCEHLFEHLNDDGVWRLKLTPHEPEELRKRIFQAIARVEYLENTKAKLAYFDINHTPSTALPKDLVSEIWSNLVNNTKLPGMDKVKEKIEQQDDPQEEGRGLISQLRKTWLMIGREKALFEQQCDELSNRYDPDTVNREQKEILDTCATVFQKWRGNFLNREEPLPTDAKEQTMPFFDEAESQAKLEEAHRMWGTVAAEGLEDYDDVRKKAEEIKAKFRKTYRLWPGKEYKSTFKFVVYSVALAALFVLQMILPYIGITMTQDGVVIARYVHFIISLLVFLSVYALGVLFWMRRMCKKLREHTNEMYRLLQESNRHRRDSIARVVKLYGEVFPKCAVVYEQQQRMKKIHEMNLQRKERFNTHEWFLTKAKELLDEMLTELRLNIGEQQENIELTDGIDYEKPPSDKANVRFYVFMSEKWGKR